MSSKLRESLLSINRLLTYHAGMEANGKAANKEAGFRVESLHRDVTALSDQSNFLSNKTNFLLDATLGLINLEQNQIIKIFSIVAVVLMPPTLIASIYGMNFNNMPELNWAMGYPMALILMVAAVWRDNLGENGAAIRMRSGGRGASWSRRTRTDASPF